MTFNDYAAARGLPDAQLWTFYSINDVSADGNKMIGAGKNPSGGSVSFLIEFIPENPVLTLNPVSMTFGEIPVGMLSAPQSLVMTNTGTGTLTINSLSLTGTNADQFTRSDNNTYPIMLGAGESAQITVTFAPTSQGLKTASIDIAASTGTLQVPLTGTGGAGVGLDEPARGSISVFLLPSRETLNVCCTGGIAQISLYDQAGRAVYNHEESNHSSTTIDVSHLEPGIYIVVCKGSDQVVRRAKVVIQK